MAYNRGTKTNIIVGAAALFVFKEGELSNIPAGGLNADLPAYVDGASYKDTLEANTAFDNVGYTTNGLEMQFQPDFGEVQVDQLLDVAKLYKQGMQVNLNTTFAEATLTNLLYATAANPDNFDDKVTDPDLRELTLTAGELGECPIERGLVAVGPGTGDCDPAEQIERIYVAYRALSIENVTVSAKRDEATMFEVSFRMLPNDTGEYGKIVDRTIPAAQA